jgi:GNAT superfamily N-acetyltransferase
MPVPLFHVDAFTDQPFAGNPAAVCLLTDERPDLWMQHVAAEMNLAETAFVRRENDGFRLRWFTPKVEVDLCGHATLAAAHVLWQEGQAPANEAIRFFTRSGVLQARHAGEHIELDFPLTPEEPVAELPGLAEALGAPPKYLAKSRFDYLVEVDSESTLRRLTPNFALLAALPIRGIIVTSRSTSPAFVLRVSILRPRRWRQRRPRDRLRPLLPGRLLAQAIEQGHVCGVPGLGSRRRRPRSDRRRPCDAGRPGGHGGERRTSCVIERGHRKVVHTDRGHETMTLTIRQACVDDLPLILEFIRKKAEFDGVPQAVQATAEALSRTLFAACPLAYVAFAEVSGKPVGFSSYFFTFSTFLARPGIWLDDLYVEENLRSQGVGRELLRFLARRARSKGCGRIEWTAAVSNERGLAFYSKHGATIREGTRLCRLDATAIDRLATDATQFLSM